jgi:hypothetical protein
MLDRHTNENDLPKIATEQFQGRSQRYTLRHMRNINLKNEKNGQT